MHTNYINHWILIYQEVPTSHHVTVLILYHVFWIVQPTYIAYMHCIIIIYMHLANEETMKLKDITTLNSRLSLNLFWVMTTVAYQNTVDKLHVLIVREQREYCIQDWNSRPLAITTRHHVGPTSRPATSGSSSCVHMGGYSFMGELNISNYLTHINICFTTR